MNKPTKAERIEYWLCAYARSSFIQTRQFLELLLKENPAYQSPLRTALTMAVVVGYARPFKQREPVKFSDTIIPPEYKGVHDEVIEIRDKIISHRDIGSPTTAWGFMNQVRVTIEGSELITNTSSPGINNDTARKLMTLIDALVQVTVEKTSHFVKQHLGPPPPDGCYIVSLEDDPEQWLVPTPPLYMPQGIPD
jgi:hypothetical protein